MGCLVDVGWRTRRRPPMALGQLFVIMISFLHVDLTRGATRSPSQSPGPAEGSCLNKICLNAAFCCSKDFYCGTNSSYCGLGCQSGPCCHTPDCSSKSSPGLSTGAIAGIVIACVVATVLVMAILFMAWRRLRGSRKAVENVAEDVENGPNDHPQQIMRGMLSSQWKNLSYETLNSATNGFSHELGHGAFGVVYKGTLEDGTEIAVKKLIDRQRDVGDFEAEIKTLGSINHNNLVALLGFTLQPNINELFLIYEFVANKSLDKWIFEKEKLDPDFVLPWETRVDILKGTAKGLAYLHGELQGGKAIIHLDIKPSNILIDEFFKPKIADFGLAKLLGSQTTHQTIANGGTPGYVAPEVFLGLPVSSKMDVYSFGMLILEVVSGREHVDHSSSSPDSLYLPSWAIRKLYKGETRDVVDPLVKEGQFEEDSAARFIKIALLCLQRDPDDRPEISGVLRMMEGSSVLQDLPSTLRLELERAEKLFRGSGNGSVL
ncbi:unnamed protein product [Calypogeia fissa]